MAAPAPGGGTIDAFDIGTSELVRLPALIAAATEPDVRAAVAPAAAADVPRSMGPGGLTAVPELMDDGAAPRARHLDARVLGS